jgi:hypothetical protein
MFCSAEDIGIVTFFSRKLFILFTAMSTEISLKSRVCLKDTPPKLKASSNMWVKNASNGVLGGVFGEMATTFGIWNRIIKAHWRK